jgi:hypothetical protein
MRGAPQAISRANSREVTTQPLKEAINEPHPSTYQRNEHTSNINDEGWQLVRSRKDRREYESHNHATQPPKKHQHGYKKGFATKQIEVAYARAFNEKLCLRCLGKDHKRSLCREPIKWLNCRLLGLRTPCSPLSTKL